MLLQPKNTKFKKLHKGRIKGTFCKNTKPMFGTYGFKAIEPGRLTARQLEAVRKIVKKKTKKLGKLWIRSFPDYPITEKPSEVRMGKGKGKVSYWVARIKPGMILFELEGVPENLVIEAFKAAENKLPFKIKFCSREFDV